MKNTAFLAVAAILALPPVALAQQQQPARQQPAQAETPVKKDWDIRLGAGASYQPDYEGSDDYEVAPIPLVMVNYRDIVFLRGPTLGANLFTLQGPREGDKLQIGPLLRYQMGRDEGDNDALRGLGDIDAGAEVGAFITYRAGPWSTGLTVFRDVSDAHDGLTARAAAGYMHAFSPKLRLRSEVATTWADDNYTETFFGITAAQSTRSGLRQYTAEGGFKDVGLTLDLDYSLTQNWGITGRLGFKRLLGDAADSPLVEDKGSANQFSTGLILSYRF
jgi:outer membrane protein